MDGAYLKEYELELQGRSRIYTDVEEITADNIFEVLSQAISIHEINMQEILFLIRYERGFQPIKPVREKVVREEINIEVSDNLANQIVEFKLGYNYGNPITYVQRGNKDISGSSPDSDDNAISALNEMNDAEMPKVGNFTDFGKAIEYGQRTKRKPHRTPDSLANSQQRIVFDDFDRDLADMEIKDWEGEQHDTR